MDLLLTSKQALGDITMLTAAVRDLHLAYPGKYRTFIDTSNKGVWENNPYVAVGEPQDATHIEMRYPLIHESHRPWHFVHAYRVFLEEALGVPIKQGPFRGDIYVSKLEKSWISQVQEITGKPTRFWLIASGGKFDCTIKWWDPNQAQKVVDHFQGRIQFVQVGSKAHHHPELSGVINLVGKTSIRQLIRLVYHSSGVLCPITSLMHLAAAVPNKQDRYERPCVVTAGGREPPHWEAYPIHRFLHTVGSLSCCKTSGCWKSRVIPLGDGDIKDTKLCLQPVKLPHTTIPRCMQLISAAKVIQAIESYYEGDIQDR